MEQAEARKKADFERRKKAEREKRKNKIMAHKKIVSRQIAKKYLDGQKMHVYRYLKDIGHFVDSYQINVMEGNVLPWLMDKVVDLVNEDVETNNTFDIFVNGHVKTDEEHHVSMVKSEHQRKADVKAEEERQRLQKEEEKRIRREKKAAKRKAEELRKLKREINETFIAKGESKEHMLLQDCENIDANHQKEGAHLCVFGGILGQIIIALSTIHKRFGGEEGVATELL